MSKYKNEIAYILQKGIATSYSSLVWQEANPGLKACAYWKEILQLHLNYLST